MEANILTQVFLPAALAIIMLGMGLTLTWDDFRRVVVMPKAVIIGLAAQILFLPLLGYGLAKVLGLPFDLAVGLMILSLCPGGPTASLITFLARGDAALSVTLTATSSIVTLFTTPLGLFLAMENLTGSGRTISLPVGQTVAFLFVITIIPVVLGMVVKAKKPEWARWGETPFKLFGLVFLVLIIGAALIREKDNVVGYFAQAGVAALLLNVLALAMGAGLALLFRLSKAQATCIAIDTGNCNGTLAVGIAATILQQPGMAITPAVYSLIMLFLGGAAVVVAPKLGRRVGKTEPLGATSLGDMLGKARTRFGKSTAMLVLTREEPIPITYDDLYEKAHASASVLHGLGLKRGDRVALLAENSHLWALADWGAQTIGVVVVPIFPTLPKETVQYILADSGATVVLTGSQEQARKCEGLGLTLMPFKGKGSFEEGLEATPTLPREAWEKEIRSTKGTELATLIYTSGTTGEPKGVMLDHKAIIHVCESVRRHLPFDQHEVFLSFLPMSHVYERVAGQALPISLGATVAYSRGLASLSAEMQQVRPSVMLCVPRFLEATMTRILENGEKLPPLDRWMFKKALEQGLKKAKGQFAPFSTVLDLLVLANVRDRLGGSFRYFVSGGAALPNHVAEFYLSIGINILQGYGLTETTGASFVNRPKRNKYWTVGEPLDVELKLAEDGEICIRGAAIMQGYWQKPEATSAAIDAEGWFHTGDVGVMEGASLKITDRKKDLFKLSNGKYIAPQPLENLLKAGDSIQEAVVFGDGQDMVTALLIPDWNKIKEELGLNGEAPDGLVKDARVRARVKADVDAVNKTLPPHEVVKRFAILPEPFSADRGELTPTMKVKRRVVQERYQEQLAEMNR